MAKTFLRFNEALEYTGLSKSSLYKLVHSRKVPHYKPNGGLLYFSVEDLDAWISSNRVATMDELEVSASAHLARR